MFSRKKDDHDDHVQLSGVKIPLVSGYMMLYDIHSPETMISIIMTWNMFGNDSHCVFIVTCHHGRVLHVGNIHGIAQLPGGG